MICQQCREAADSRLPGHTGCIGSQSCFCQHRGPSPKPEESNGYVEVEA